MQANRYRHEAKDKNNQEYDPELTASAKPIEFV
jgi:hypothetical protein